MATVPQGTLGWPAWNLATWRRISSSGPAVPGPARPARTRSARCRTGRSGAVPDSGRGSRGGRSHRVPAAGGVGPAPGGRPAARRSRLGVARRRTRLRFADRGHRRSGRHRRDHNRGGIVGHNRDWHTRERRPASTAPASSSSAPANSSAVPAPATSTTTLPIGADCDGLSPARPEVRCMVGAVDVDIRLFTPKTIAAGYRRATGTGTDPVVHSGPAACASGLADERAWSTATAPSVTAGRYRCGFESGHAAMWWTQGNRLVHAVVARRRPRRAVLLVARAPRRVRA